MRRHMARAALLVLVAALLAALYAVRIHIAHRIWPVTSFHPRLLAFIAADGMAVVGIVGAIAAVVLVVRWLLRAAELG